MTTIPSRPQSASSETPMPREAYTLLAQANLLRMRGRWDEAVEACMAALRIAPDNASAQSLLGDIYENQGRNDDAIQWYRMALDVNPESPADKLKLQRLLNADPRRWADTPSTGTIVVSRPAPVASPKAQRSDADRLLRGIVWLTAALFLVAVALGGVIMSRHRAPAATITTTPVVVAPPSDPAISGDPATNSTANVSPPAAPSSPATPPVAGANTSVTDPSEQALLQTLQQDTTLTGQNITPVGVQIDPRQNSVIVTAVCPAPAGASVRAGLAVDALLIALAGNRAQNSGVATWTIRCLAALSSTPTASTPDLAFVGDTTPAALAALGANPATLPPAQILPAFHNLWWSPTVTQ